VSRSRRARMVPWALVLRRDWDQVLQALLMIVFGCWGVTGARQRSLEPLGSLTMIFDAEFIVVGVLLIIGLRTNSWALRRRAYVVYSVALLLLAGLLAFYGPSPFIALALAFAMQGVVTIRILHRQERMAMRMISEADLSPDQAWELGRQIRPRRQHEAP
jgi:hypothetical protein